GHSRQARTARQPVSLPLRRRCGRMPGMDPRPRTRTPLRVALWIVAAVVAFALMAWGALAVAFPPARVRELVSARLSSVLARDVRFADASLGIWPPVRLT